MMQESQDRSELVGALLAAEYADAGIEVDAMRAVRAGEHGEWLVALEATGLFDHAALNEIALAWARDPELLRDALLAEADEFTRRRCLAAWAQPQARPATAMGG